MRSFIQSRGVLNWILIVSSLGVPDSDIQTNIFFSFFILMQIYISRLMNEKPARRCNKSVVIAEGTNRLSAAHDKGHRSSSLWVVSLLNLHACVGSTARAENKGKENTRTTTSKLTFVILQSWVTQTVFYVFLWRVSRASRFFRVN